MTRVLPSDQSEALQQRKMRAVYEGSAPVDTEILSRMAAARIRSARSSTRAPKRVGPMVIGVIAALFSCGTAFAWGVHTGVVRVPFLESIAEPAEQRSAPKEEKKNRSRGTRNAVAERKTPIDEPVAPLDEENVHSEMEKAPPRSLAKKTVVPTEDLFNVPRRISSGSAAARKPTQPDERAKRNAQNSSWVGVTRSLNEGKLEVARAATEELERSEDRATREAAQLLSIQLRLKQQGSNPTLTEVERQRLRVLADAAISMSVRRASAQLLKKSSH